MGRKLNAGQTKRRDIYLIEPQHVMVREELRGRKFQPTPEQIMRRAISLFVHGQIQPITARVVDENKVESVAGFTRVSAGRLLREGFEFDGQRYHNPDFMLEVKIRNVDDLQALLINIEENNERNQTSDVDDAFNHQRLRQGFGYNDTQIAKAFGYPNGQKVGRLKKLLKLTEEEQLLVHTGALSTSAGIELLSMTPEQRAEVVAKASKGIKVSATELADQVRDTILADSDTDSVGGISDDDEVKVKARTMANVRKYMAAMLESDQPALVRFSKDFSKWLSGKCTDKTMDNGMKRILEAKPEKTPVKKAA